MTEAEKMARFKKIYEHLREVNKELKKDSSIYKNVFFDTGFGMIVAFNLKKKYSQVCISANDPDKKDILIGFYTQKAIRTGKPYFQNHSLTWDLSKDTEKIKSIIAAYI